MSSIYRQNQQRVTVAITLYVRAVPDWLGSVSISDGEAGNAKVCVGLPEISPAWN